MSHLEERIALPSERASIPRARHFARRVVGSGVRPDVLELVELLTSELVTNAVLHSGTACELRIICTDDDTVRVEVADGSRQRPKIRRNADPLALDGRGLQFVERLATRWGVDVDPLGKMVWFELAG
ncbi:MAG: hypothetical protein QOE63_1523 [Acidimicrobiaceae bacterium]